MLRKLLPTFAMFALIVGGYYLWLQKTHDALQVSTVESIAAIQDVQATVEPAATTEIKDTAIGSENAPITIIEYASFTCPHCAHFHETVFGKIRANYVDTGKVRFVMRDVYFDRLGLWAALLARCGEGEKFFGITDLVFTTQREWTHGTTNLEIVNNLKKIGRIAGMGEDQMDQCLQDNDMAHALVAAYDVNKTKDDIKGTPSFLINGEKYPNMTYADFSKVLDGILAKL